MDRRFAFFKALNYDHLRISFLPQYDQDEMNCLSERKLILSVISLRLISMAGSCPFDSTWKCDEDQKISVLVSVNRGRNFIDLKCTMAADVDVRTLVDLSPSGSGTQCETYEYGLRHREPCFFGKALSKLPFGLTVPVERIHDWIVEYKKAKIIYTQNELIMSTNVEHCESIRFVLTKTDLYLPFLQHDAQLGESKTKFQFTFKSGILEFEIENERIKVNDKIEWMFGTHVMELLDVRLKKIEQMDYRVVFNKKEFVQQFRLPMEEKKPFTILY